MTPFERMMALARHANEHPETPLSGPSEGICSDCGKEHKTEGDLVNCVYGWKWETLVYRDPLAEVWEARQRKYFEKRAAREARRKAKVPKP